MPDVFPDGWLKRCGNAERRKMIALKDRTRLTGLLAAYAGMELIFVGKAKYILSRLGKMSLSRVLPLADKVCARSGKSRAAVLLDMAWCGIRYQAGYTDYELFAMERAGAKQRKTYITRGINDKLVKRFNDADSRHIFVNKDEFNEAFADFLGRRWLKILPADSNGFCLEDEVKKLQRVCKDCDEIVAKPRDGMCGKGIEMLNTAQHTDMKALYEYLQSSGAGIVEQCIIQHPVMSELYPDSINTLRIVTINNGGKISVVVALCRMGNGGRVDNFLHGGLMTRVSLGDGVLMFDAVNSENEVFQKHPITGTVFKGFKIPMWSECMKKACKAAAVLPEVGDVGWDFAVTPSGPVLVEGNEFPGHCLYQLPPHTPDNYGLLPVFRKAIDERT